MMNSNLSIGSVVYGSAGIGCKVIAIEGDVLTIETDSGTRKISTSKIVSWEPPTPTRFKVGERVRFCGGLPRRSSTLAPTERSIKLGLPIGCQLTIESIDGDEIIAKTIYRSFQLTAEELEAIA